VRRAMTEEQARAMIGRSWQDVRSEQDWRDWDPVLDDEGRIVDVCSVDLSIDEAAERGWIYDYWAHGYVIDRPLAAMLSVILAYDGQANAGGGDGAVVIAREWLDAGFDPATVRRWLDVNVCEVHHALELTAGQLPRPEGRSLPRKLD